MSEKQRLIVRKIGDGHVVPTSARFSFFPSQENPEEVFLSLKFEARRRRTTADELRVVFRVPPGEDHYDLIQREEGREVGLRPRSSDHDGWCPGMVVIQSKEINLGDFPLVIIADEAGPCVYLQGLVKGSHVKAYGSRGVFASDGWQGRRASEAMIARLELFLDDG